MGADFNQTVKAIAEAEAYPGPSLSIAYAPCINHGIQKGMEKAQTEEELAVKAGYWHCSVSYTHLLNCQFFFCLSFCHTFLDTMVDTWSVRCV